MTFRLPEQLGGSASPLSRRQRRQAARQAALRTAETQAAAALEQIVRFLRAPCKENVPPLGPGNATSVFYIGREVQPTLYSRAVMGSAAARIVIQRLRKSGWKGAIYLGDQNFKIVLPEAYRHIREWAP